MRMGSGQYAHFFVLVADQCLKHSGIFLIPMTPISRVISPHLPIYFRPFISGPLKTPYL